MKYIVLLGCVFFSFAFAETIQNVDFHLPQAAQDWVIGNKIEGDKGSTVIYIPKGAGKQNAKEFFGVNATRLLSNPNDYSELKMVLGKMYPALKINFEVIEKYPNGLIYEWSGEANGIQKVHGWGRGFSSQEGTVLLGYQTEQLTDLPKTRSIWLPVLRNAISRTS